MSERSTRFFTVIFHSAFEHRLILCGEQKVLENVFLSLFRSSLPSRRKLERKRERGYMEKNEIGLPVHVVLQLDLYRTIPRGLVLVVVLILRYLCENRGRQRQRRQFVTLCRSRKFLVGDGALLFSIISLLYPPLCSDSGVAYPRNILLTRIIYPPNVRNVPPF